jgi:hypothetical protein
MFKMGWIGKSIIFLCIAVFCVIETGKTQVVKKKTLIGVRLIDAYSGIPVVFANVINQQRSWWAVSDTTGLVRVPGFPGDTVAISSIGYKLTKFVLTDSIVSLDEPFTIMMFERMYEISKIEIHALGTYEDFKYRLLHMKIDDKMANVKWMIKLGIAKIPQYPYRETPTISLGSPITALYNLFSKEGKSKRKLQEALQQENLILYAETKYNRALVARITGLQNDKLDEFILKYRPSLEYLLKTSEYEVIGKIIQDYDTFKKERK